MIFDYGTLTIARPRPSIAEPDWFVNSATFWPFRLPVTLKVPVLHQYRSRLDLADKARAVGGKLR